jgi:hypothetical protein
MHGGIFMGHSMVKFGQSPMIERVIPVEHEEEEDEAGGYWDPPRPW